MSEEFQQVDVTLKVTFSVSTKLTKRQLEDYVDRFASRLQHRDRDLMEVKVVHIAEEAEIYDNT